MIDDEKEGKRFALWVKEDLIPPIQRKHHWKTWCRALGSVKQEQHITTKPVKPIPWQGLHDSNWVNIVNHAHCYEDFSKEDAVHHAVKLTEAKLKELNSTPKPNTFCPHCGKRSAGIIHTCSPQYLPPSPEAVISNEELSALLKKASGHDNHYSDCSIYNAPAMRPEPCDCGAINRHREAIIKATLEAGITICKEMGEHWSAYKDTALLNGDIDLSLASSGEPRAAQFIQEQLEALANDPQAILKSLEGKS